MSATLDLIRRKLLDALTPVVKQVGQTHMPYTHKLVTGVDYFAVQKLIRPGMVWLTHTEGEASTLLIPGFFTHAAMAIDEKSVVQATGASGVAVADLVSFMLSKDYVVLLRPTFATDVQMSVAAAWAAKQVGAPYDYEFGMNVKAFYCSELVWASYRDTIGDSVPFVMTEELGVRTVSPDSIWQDKGKFETVWQSASCVGRRLV